MLTHKYHFFYGGFCSQWASCIFKDSLNTYTSAEQFMMYKKAMLFKDCKTAARILQKEDPEEIKALGKQVQGFDEQLWKAFRFSIVFNGNALKFCQNEDFKNKLLRTYPKMLVEASPYDKIWGIGFGIDDPKIENVNEWGLNLLGKALMRVRESFMVVNNFKIEV